MSPFLITDQPGFTPHIGRLVSMMNYARRTTLEMVRGLSTEELDFSDGGNSIGMLLEHMAAVEAGYQYLTFGGKWIEPTDPDFERWQPGLELGALGQEKLKGKDLGYYLSTLQSVRDKTYAGFAQRDDAWLHTEFPFWGGQLSNNYFCWFHVFEDEINHRGQIRLIAKALPKNKNRGVLGIQVGPAHEDIGLKIGSLNPNGPAGKAGVRVGDVVLELNGLDIEHTPNALIDFRGQAGEVVQMKVRREGVTEPLEIEVTRVKPS